MAIDETTIQITWDASKPCDQVQYSLNGGAWIGAGYPTITIAGLNANQYYDVKIRIQASDSKLWTTSASKGVTTYDYPKPTTINDFVIGDGASVTLYNPLARNCTLDIISNTNGAVIGTYSGTYNGVVNAEFKTADAIAKQYASIPSSPSGTYYARVIYGNSVKTLGNRTYSIRGTEKPSFSSFTYEDINDKTKSLTGNNQILINGYSNLKAIISTANKAYSNYGSPIDKYRLNVGNMGSVEEPYSSTNIVELYINKVNSPSITVTAIDKRSQSQPVLQTASFKDYFKPVVSKLVANRSDGGIGSQVTLSFEGNWWNNNFGQMNNSIKQILYYYKKTTDSYWTEGNILIIPTISGNDFSGNIEIEGPNTDDKGFDVSAAYNVKIVVTDELDTSNEYQTILGTGTPAIAIWENKVSIGSKYDEVLGGLLQVGGNKITANNFYSNTYDSYFDDVVQIIGKNFETDKIYIITNAPINDGNYIQYGATHTVIGMETWDRQFGYQFSLSYNYLMIRQKWYGAWQKWEQIRNKEEITTGVEYVTGRIIDGKTEYAKKIDCGYLPAAKSPTYTPHGLTNFVLTRPPEGYAFSSYNTYIPLPFVERDEVAGYNVTITVSQQNIVMDSDKGQSHYYGYVTLYYTKI